MNDKNTFFKNKLFVSAFLVVFIVVFNVSLFSTQVFAVMSCDECLKSCAGTCVVGGGGCFCYEKLPPMVAPPGKIASQEDAGKIILSTCVDQAMVDFPFLGKIFGNERMNVYIGGQAPFNIVTSGGKVESLGAGEIGNPSMKVYADMGTINQLIAGELTPLDALLEGKIKYEGVGFVRSVKVGALKFVSGLLSRIIPFYHTAVGQK